MHIMSRAILDLFLSMVYNVGREEIYVTITIPTVLGKADNVAEAIDICEWLEDYPHIFAYNIYYIKQELYYYGELGEQVKEIDNHRYLVIGDIREKENI